MTFIDDYCGFLNASPTAFHAAFETTRRLLNAGFDLIAESDQWPSEPGRYVVNRGAAVVAFEIPAPGASGYAIYGAHTDSPSLKLKPTEDHTSPDGWNQLCVEVYGGPIYNSWLNRELIVAGKVITTDGQEHLVSTSPIAIVPQLAIHLDRGVNDGLTLDPQTHLQPIWDIDADYSILDVVAGLLSLSGEDILAHDLFCVPSQKAATFGPDQQFIASRNQDNLSSVYAGLVGFTASHASNKVNVFAAFDHEEVGSASPTGAAGPLLESVLLRTSTALGKDLEGHAQMLAKSFLISADAGHGVNPNYAASSDPDTRPMLGRGPLAKINAKQRYATNADSLALWRQICTAGNIPTQDFVSNNSIACGSTIGPISATRLGIPTVDVGVPMLSMHSTREVTHEADLRALRKAAQTYFDGDYPQW